MGAYRVSANVAGKSSMGLVADAAPVVRDGPPQRLLYGCAHVGADIAIHDVTDLADLREKLCDKVSHGGLQVDVGRRHV